LNAVLSTFGAFLAALARPRTPLVRAIRLVLAIKLIAIAGIGAAVHSGLWRQPVDTGAMSRLIGPSPSALDHEGR
jgi:hypothetical protein